MSHMSKQAKELQDTRHRASTQDSDKARALSIGVAVVLSRA